MRIDWTRLLLTYLMIGSLAPVTGVVLLFLLTTDPHNWWHSGAALAFFATLFFAHLFLGLPFALTAIFVSPFLFCISRVPNRVVGSLVAIALGAGVGFLFEEVFIRNLQGRIKTTDQVLFSVIGALSAFFLERAMRRTMTWQDGDHI